MNYGFRVKNNRLKEREEEKGRKRSIVKIKGGTTTNCVRCIVKLKGTKSDYI